MALLPLTHRGRLASFLPLARQVVHTHAAGKVAPLQGVAAIQVEGVSMWYAQAAAKDSVTNLAKIRLLDKPLGSVEILSEHKRTCGGLRQSAARPW